MFNAKGLITDLFHKRQQKLRGEIPDVYQYDKFPEKLKIQIVHIWKENLGVDSLHSSNREYYEFIHQILLKELAVFELRKESFKENPNHSLFITISHYFLYETDVEKSLSVVELVARVIEHFYLERYQDSQPFIQELNQRFKEHGFGYQYESGQIIRVDSQFIHSEAVKPTLMVLSQPMYKGAQEEFLRAHEHYRYQRYQEAMVDCLKAYESTIKIIMKKHKWEYNENDTADALTGKLLQKGLVPEYWLQYFKSLKNTLTAGVPTVRNKEAGHGQADELKNIPDYLVSYVLHMTASVILFLVKAEESLS